MLLTKKNKNKALQHSFCFSKFNEFLHFYLTLIDSGMQFIFRYFNDIRP